MLLMVFVHNVAVLNHDSNSLNLKIRTFINGEKFPNQEAFNQVNNQRKETLTYQHTSG
jgi:hypothetical protein